MQVAIPITPDIFLHIVKIQRCNTHCTRYLHIITTQGCDAHCNRHFRQDSRLTAAKTALFCPCMTVGGTKLVDASCAAPRYNSSVSLSLQPKFGSHLSTGQKCVYKSSPYKSALDKTSLEKNLADTSYLVTLCPNI